jgi:sugar O-acyltransferase (sialic acid O-acetyltransferase NeuD family)
MGDVGAIIVGNGGMARELLDLICFAGNIRVDGFFWPFGTELCGLPIYNVVPDQSLILGMLNHEYRLENIARIGRDKFIRVTDGYISRVAHIGHGATVVHGAYVMADAVIEDFVHVHTCATVGHDCVVGENTFLGPYSMLGGNVKTGRNCMVGMGARLLPGVVLGDNVVVGAGAVVTKDIASHATVYGLPARPATRLKRRASMSLAMLPDADGD